MKSELMLNEKAQFWYSDFLIAIFILAIISFLFIINIAELNSKQDNAQLITNEAISISNNFMSEGYCPTNCYSDWINKDGRVGFVHQGRVEMDKLNDFINLVSNDYDISKILLGTKNDYVFYFENSDNNKIRIGDSDYLVYGKVNDIAEINADSFIKINRFVYLPIGEKGEIVKLVVVVW